MTILAIKTFGPTKTLLFLSLNHLHKNYDLNRSPTSTNKKFFCFFFLPYEISSDMSGSKRPVCQNFQQVTIQSICISFNAICLIRSSESLD